MINLTFKFNLPFWNRFKTVFKKSGVYYKDISWMLSCYYIPSQLINLELHLRTKCDHAGLMIGVGLLGVCLEYEIYSSRHWNYEDDRWYRDGEERPDFEYD